MRKSALTPGRSERSTRRRSSARSAANASSSGIARYGAASMGSWKRTRIRAGRGKDWKWGQARNAPAMVAASRDRLLIAAVSLAVALAVADSSVVVLALPAIYGTFDVSIVTVSWTITAYNVGGCVNVGGRAASP